MEPQTKAQDLFNQHYVKIIEYGEELSQEIIVSLLAKQHALITAREIYNDNYSNPGVLQYWKDVMKYLYEM